VKLAKIKSTKDFDYIKESATGYGQFVGDLLIKGISLEDIEKIRDQMNAVTKEDLKQVIQEVFSKNPRVITIGLPQEEKVKQ
jgi:predicted Zn-dependent peptidase